MDDDGLREWCYRALIFSGICTSDTESVMKISEYPEYFFFHQYRYNFSWKFLFLRT